MFDVSDTHDARRVSGRQPLSRRQRRIAFDADMPVELAIGGTRIPLPTAPFVPVEPLRAPRMSATRARRAPLGRASA
ncbi:MAG TPA: hypothetical protein VFI22_03355 [Thermomicrobiales bacterium]|nr:hypothetical protein [Thermomicrobiales bacterium]